MHHHFILKQHVYFKALDTYSIIVLSCWSTLLLDCFQFLFLLIQTCTFCFSLLQFFLLSPLLHSGFFLFPSCLQIFSYSLSLLFSVNNMDLFLFFCCLLLSALNLFSFFYVLLSGMLFVILLFSFLTLQPPHFLFFQLFFFSCSILLSRVCLSFYPFFFLCGNQITLSSFYFQPSLGFCGVDSQSHNQNERDLRLAWDRLLP